MAFSQTIRTRSAFVTLMLLASVTGCRPTPSAEELGQLHFEVPHVKGSDAPIHLPELNGPPPSYKSHNGGQRPDLAPIAPGDKSAAPTDIKADEKSPEPGASQGEAPRTDVPGLDKSKNEPQAESK